MLPGRKILRLLGSCSLLCGSNDSLVAIIQVFRAKGATWRLRLQENAGRDLPSPALPGAGSTGLLRTSAELSAFVPVAGLVGSPESRQSYVEVAEPSSSLS